MEKEIIKRFHEARSDTFHDTLKSAKAAARFPYVKRVWLRDGKVIGWQEVYAYGDSRGTIKGADEIIAKRVELMNAGKRAGNE